MKSCCARGSRNAAQLAGSDPRSGGSLPANPGSLPPPRNKTRNAQPPADAARCIAGERNGDPDFVLLPAVVERVEGLSSKCLLRLGYELEVGETDLRVLLSVFKFAGLEVPNKLVDSVRRSGPHALCEFGFGGGEVPLLGANADEIELVQAGKKSTVPL